MIDYKVTAILLNYKRPENLKELIESIRNQNIPIQIMLWHNGVADDIPFADWVLRSNRNMGCLARWHMAALSGADYVFTLDDDLAITENDFIEKCLKISKKHDDTKIIGKSGKVLGKGLRKYTRGEKKIIDNSQNYVSVDIIKGRFMFVPVKLLSKVPLVFKGYQGRGDDIWISLLTSKAKYDHLLPIELSTGLKELDSKGVGLAEQGKEHLVKREKIVADIVSKGLVSWQKVNIINYLFPFFWGGYLKSKKIKDHRLVFSKFAAVLVNDGCQSQINLLKQLKYLKEGFQNINVIEWRDPNAIGDSIGDWIIESNKVYHGDNLVLIKNLLALSGAERYLLEILDHSSEPYYLLDNLSNCNLG